MSDMLRIVNADLITAEYLMSREDDEVYLNFSGYHLSQAANKLLINRCLEVGVIPPKVRKITEILNFMENRGILDDRHSPLREHSRTLDDWISETRYVVACLATRNQLTAIVLLLKNIYQEALLEQQQQEWVEEPDENGADEHGMPNYFMDGFPEQE